MKKKKMLFIILMAMLVLPTKVFALTDNEIKEKKELTIDSVPITKEDELWPLNETLYYKIGYQLKDCNSSFTSCTVYKGNNDENVIATNVTIKYEYDSDVKKVVDGILGNIPKNGKTFYIEDIYAIKWILDENSLLEVDENSEGLNPIKYSPEFNSFIGYNNFTFEPRMGEDTMYAHFAEGSFQFKYNDTIYGYGRLATRVDNVVYVNDNETDIAGALKTRLSKYFNIKAVTKEESFTIDELLNDELDSFKDDYNTCLVVKPLQGEIATLENEIQELNNVAEADRDEEWNNALNAKYETYNTKSQQLQNMNFYGSCDMLDEYNNVDSYIEYMRGLLTDANSPDALWNKVSKALPNVYVITFTDNSIESGIPVFVVKDSSKVFNDELEVKTRDAKSGVTINNTSTSKSLPFDTLIKVSKLTSGSDYEKIVKVLKEVINEDNIEMFDLKLFSSSIANYITKLDDGSFEVKIPLSDNLKGKSLTAYYVDDNGNVKEYEVNIEVVDGVQYAVFTTDHFSVYTLSGKEEENPEPKYKITYDFNGGKDKDGKEKLENEQVGYVVEISKANFIDHFEVTPPEGKELEAIEINGKKYEFGEGYELNKDTVFKYLWKSTNTEEEPTLPDESTSTNTESVPQTFDNINSYITMLIISTIGLGIILINRKKLLNNK